MENRIEITGHKFKADFGDYAFELHFESETQLTWKALASDGFGASEPLTSLKLNYVPIYT